VLVKREVSLWNLTRIAIKLRIMQTNVKNAVWILEVNLRDDEYIHIFSDHIPIDKDVEMMKLKIRKQYGNVPMRILSPEEVVEVKAQLVPVERRSPDRSPLSHNKNRRVVN
jgi:hypothetical protein